MFKYWDWEDTIATIFWVFVGLLLVLGGVAFTADHSVVDYTLTQSSGAVCVTNVRNWAANDTAYCGSPENAISVYLSLKNQLQKKKAPHVLAPNEVEL